MRICLFLLLTHSLAAQEESYPLDPAARKQDGVPAGALTKHAFAASRIFPGTHRDYWLYVPAQYKADTPACLMVFQDGRSYVGKPGNALMPEALRWIWKDHGKVPVRTHPELCKSRASQWLIPGEDWQVVSEGHNWSEGMTVTADGRINYCALHHDTLYIATRHRQAPKQDAFPHTLEVMTARPAARSRSGIAPLRILHRHPNIFPQPSVSGCHIVLSKRKCPSVRIPPFMPDLPPHFSETLALLKVTDPGGEAWREIQSCYSEPGRHYHTLDHVAYCLDQLAGTAHDPPLLRLALYYHDIVYDPCGDDNELLSARFATDRLSALGLPDSKTAVVYDLIRATNHRNSPPVPHSDLICDIDLAVLGADPGTYAAYADNIRREYGWMPDHKFNRGRTNILMAFLERPAIYQTPEFHKRLEDQARINLTNEVIRLRG